jgi:2-polyprenyl-3-methyl-5-hydroxy-6-metoxy-1,4-benzoquinol methylase
MSSTNKTVMHDAVKSEIEIERELYDEIYSRADLTTPLRHPETMPKGKLLWDRHVGDLAGKHVLECGCGDGRYAVWLASLGATVVGIDLSPVGAERTLQRARAHGFQDRVTAHAADCAHLETVLPANSFDLVVGFSVLHHLPPKEFGEGVARVLKPGGRAIFFENSNANPLFRLGRTFCNNETICGSPLTAEEADTFIAGVGSGQRVYPYFGLFRLTKKYVLRNNKLFKAVVEGVDAAIDAIPGTQRWSAHMWVSARKDASIG